MVNNNNIPKLIIITSPEPVYKEFEIINSLFDEGLECLHVRKPDYDLPELEHWLQHVNPHNLNKIVIHSHYELAEKIRLKGIHFINEFLKQTLEKDIFTIVQKANSEKLTISASMHKTEELKKIKFNYDYVFLSPVFDSISKQGYKSAFNLNELSVNLKNQNNISVIALGGIDEGNIELALQSGFAGVALLGAIWNTKNTDIIEKFRRIKKIII
jgi:thiamine-phosphate pyrophosphorylase